MFKKTLIVLFLYILVVGDVFAATASTSLFTVNKNTKKIPLSDNIRISQLKGKYCKSAEKLSASGDHLGSSILYQNLIDDLNSRAKTMPVSKWLLSYNAFYQETLATQLKERNLYNSSRVASLASSLKNQQQASKLKLAKMPQIVSRMPLAVNGDLSLDSKQILTVTPSFSPFYASQNIISIFSAVNGKKIYEELPIPDDRNNPQINRWGWTYSVSRAKWAPDGTRYAYLLNGALCVNSVAGKPALISYVPDSKVISDLDFSWSYDGNSLVYIRQQEDGKYVYLASPIDTEETKLGKGNFAAVSFDGSYAVFGQGNKHKLYNAVKKKVISSFTGTNPIFSSDAKSVVFIKNNAIYIKNISNLSESLVYKLSNNVASFAPLCMNIYGVSLKTGEMLLVSSDGSISLGKTNGKILPDVLQSPYRIVCEKEVLLLK